VFQFGSQKNLLVSCFKIQLYLRIFNWALWHEDIRGSGCIALPFLTSVVDGGEWSVSQTGRLSRRNLTRYSLDRRSDGPQNRSGRCGEKKNIIHSDNRTSVVRPVAITTDLSFPPFYGKIYFDLVSLFRDPIYGRMDESSVKDGKNLGKPPVWSFND
jgi:hypothetical protein